MKHTTRTSVAGKRKVPRPATKKPGAAAPGMLKLPALFTDHMVLQRAIPAPVWGSATPGSKVTVSIAGKSAACRADSDGRFRARLPALTAGGPYTLLVRSSTGQSAKVRDVLVGEVWICSGQSNMDGTAGFGTGFTKAEIARARHPRMRLFVVPKAPAEKPMPDVKSCWTPATPQTVANFSGAGYGFGREILEHLDVPVGLIHAAWGGTMAEAWTPEEAMDAVPELRPIVDRWRGGDIPLPDSPEYKTALVKWEDDMYWKDPGNEGEKRGWHAKDFDDSGWETMDLPRNWESTGLDIDGSVWFRKRVDIPAEWAGKDLTLSLGPVDDFDTTYVNGKCLGGIGPDRFDAYQVPRVYTVPAALAGSGSLSIAVRVFDRFGGGGIYGATQQMFVKPAGGADEIIIAGQWLYKVELALKPKQPVPVPLHRLMESRPGVLYNGLIAPLVPFALRGVLWYQGESNVERAEQYRLLLPAMINAWRKVWGRRMAFLAVGLANFNPRRDYPCDSDWAELRDAQIIAANSVPHAWLVGTNDSGHPSDIHPQNKPLVGFRLSLAARANVYGERTLKWCGPRFKSFEVEGNCVRIRFTNDSGLCALGGGMPLRGFAIAGADRVFHWANATITDDGVLVISPKVAKPEAVRYCWAGTMDVNLVNAWGLPAEPFRTDNWPLLTAGRR